MEEAEPIKCETPEPIEKKDNIDFFEELKINKENEEYKIQFEIKNNKKKLLIKALPEFSNDIFCFQHYYTKNELQNLSLIFAEQENIKDIITLLKKSKSEVERKNEDLIIKFNINVSEDKNELVKFNLKKFSMDIKQMIKYLFDEIKSIKINNNLEKEKQESEIKLLQEVNLNIKIIMIYVKNVIKRIKKQKNIIIILLK